MLIDCHSCHIHSCLMETGLHTDSGVVAADQTDWKVTAVAFHTDLVVVVVAADHTDWKVTAVAFHTDSGVVLQMSMAAAAVAAFHHRTEVAVPISELVLLHTLEQGLVHTHRKTKEEAEVVPMEQVREPNYSWQSTSRRRRSLPCCSIVHNCS